MKAIIRRGTTLLGVALLLQGCASSAALTKAREQFYSGQTTAAYETLDVSTIAEKSRLLGYLDKGLIAHTAGLYEASSLAFLEAAKLLDSLDFVSIKEQSTSLISNDWSTSYKGEYSERLWIHSFQMMNFLLLERPESAAVEARQALKLFENHTDALKNDWVTRALIAMSFEAVGQKDSAHIEYKKLINDIGTSNGITALALQNAKLLGRQQDVQMFTKMLPNDSAKKAEQQGELIVFVETGAIATKEASNLLIADDIMASFPSYPEYISSGPVSISVTNNGKPIPSNSLSTYLLNISRQALAERGKSLVAKGAARLTAKKLLAKELSKENEILGGVMGLIFMISEQADTRSWETLPEHLTLMQIPLDAGPHQLQISVNSGNSHYSVTLPEVQIQANKRSYTALRLGAGATIVQEPPTSPAPDNNDETSSSTTAETLN